MNPQPRKEITREGFRKAFAERLIAIRKTKKMTVKELADVSGVNETTLHRWESAENCPVNEQLLDIAEALGVNISKIIPSKKDLI